MSRRSEVSCASLVGVLGLALLVPVSAGAGEEADDVVCSDGIDNDQDGFIDCDDFDCSMNPAVSVCGGGGENTNALCSDQIDNDLDGFTDCDDFDCSHDSAVTVCDEVGETSDTTCSDGLDNDLDGFTDCDDFDCSMNPSVTVCPEPTGLAFAALGILRILRRGAPGSRGGHPRPPELDAVPLQTGVSS